MMVDPVLLSFIINFGNKDPEACDNMLQDEKCDKQIKKTLGTGTYLQHITKMSNHFVLNFHETNEAQNFCESYKLVHFPDSRESSKFIDISEGKNCVKWNDREQVKKKPGLQILQPNALKKT
jgi:hypothetical protein